MAAREDREESNGDCRAEMCPMWDGDTCPCETFELDPDDLPRDGVFTITTREEPLS